ncbi:hypothetical protein Acr_25g0002980 [Actinidia rufa]|uniref:NADP-dependent oxidoreductase domain-containing protein n=1 Tax=Actinidia rufa TaxID=165716 RepID=A0A7J0GYI7_9ERIC|nr:hypothetical protein Acr_25g0002980 [Actinidia rufa]
MKGKIGTRGSHFLLNTGQKIPAIGLGTWQSGGDLCVEAVKTALSVGYRHVDCAHLYGNEVEVGEALGEAFNDTSLKREDVFLTSKLFCTMNSLNKMENSVRVSLKNLGVSYLDLYLMHWPESSAFGDATDPPTKSGNEYRQFLSRFKTTWKAMEGLVELGLVRAIGVSNFSIQQIKELLKFAKNCAGCQSGRLLILGLRNCGSSCFGIVAFFLLIKNSTITWCRSCLQIHRITIVR